MDRNSAIGLTLMALLLLGYFYFFSPAPEAQKQKPVTTAATLAAKDSTQQSTETKIDSAAAKQYGDLGSFLTGKEEFTSIENDVLKVTFSNHGTLSEVNLKNYKTYGQQPLFLAKGGNNKFALNTTYNGQSIDLYQLHYQPEVVKQGDSTLVNFTAKLSESAFLKHVYSIPLKGYKIGYKIESQGVALAGKEVSFNWNDIIALQEKDLNDSRNKTTINYYSATGDFDGLSETSSDSKTLSEPMKWISIKQKFFLSAIFADDKFSASSLAITVDPKDSSMVKK